MNPDIWQQLQEKVKKYDKLAGGDSYAVGIFYSDGTGSIGYCLPEVRLKDEFEEMETFQTGEDNDILWE